MQEATNKEIEEIFSKAQTSFLQDVQDAGPGVERIFEAIMRVFIKQKEEYSRLFETSGFLPKDLNKALNMMVSVSSRNLLRISDPQQLEHILDFSRLFVAEMGNQAPLLVQIKASVDGKQESFYFFEPYKASVTAGSNIWPDFSNWVRAHRVPVQTELVMHTKRLPVTVELFEELMKRLCADDNWQIEETDPIEHYQEQAFQWDKAFGSLFEPANASC